MSKPGEREALVDVDHLGLLRCQPQSHRGEHGRYLLAQRLGVAAFPGHHDDKIVGVPGKPPVSLAISPALGPLVRCSHRLLPLPVEMIIQR
jgi:hypothetical protein